MMSPDGFQSIALSMPEVEVRPRGVIVEFQVSGTLFARLWSHSNHAMVALSAEHQRRYVRSYVETFAPMRGSWGRRGGTRVRLAIVKAMILRYAVRDAWQLAAPRHLTNECGGRRHAPVIVSYDPWIDSSGFAPPAWN